MILVVILVSCNYEPVAKVEDQNVPEIPVDGIVCLDLSRWNSINNKDVAQVEKLWDEMHLAATLQGIVNREAPRLYINYVGSVDKYWWDMYSKPGKWLDGKEVVTVSDVGVAVDMFIDKIKGLVVYDPNVTSTSCVASTVAGVEDLLAVRYDTTPGSVYTRMMKRNIEVKCWLVGEDGSSIFHSKLEPYQWAVDNYLKTNRCNPEYAAYYIDQYWRKTCANAPMNHHQLTNHDYFVARKAFFFDLSPWDDESATDAPDEPVGADAVMLRTILSEIHRMNGGRKFCHIGGFPAWAYKYSSSKDAGGKHLATETEWKCTEIISAYDAYKDADALAYGAMANASFWTHYPLKDKYSQKWVTRDELKAKGYLTADGKVNMNKRYMLFYIGDYDAAAWLYQMMPTIWNDEARGKVPLMWSISPVLERRAPMVMEHLWESATDLDYFAAADNGAGYLNPGGLEDPRASGFPSSIDAWADHCTPFYNRWDITVTGFIIDGNCKGMSNHGFECYSRFSPNGIVPQRAPQAALVGNMPVMASMGGTGSDDIKVSAENVLYNITTHTSFPFYWYRTVLKTPSWHLALKEQIENQDNKACWLSGPEFFELLRCYLEERQ